MHIRRCCLGLIAAALALNLLAGGSQSRGDVPPLPDPTASDISQSEQSEISGYVSYYANQISTAGANASQQVDLRNQMFSPLNKEPSPLFLYSFGSQVADKFAPLLNNPQTALSAAVVAAQVNDMSTQPLLESALANGNAAVRYWGAKGLGEILPALAAIGPSYQQAVNALEKAAAIEQDPVVASEIANALSQSNPPDANTLESVLTVLGRVTAGYDAQIPNDLTSASEIADDLAQLLNSSGLKLNANDQLTAMTELTNLISFTAQYNAAGLLDHSQKMAVPDTITASIAAMNAVSGGDNFSVNANADAAALLMKVNDITGAPGISGQVQKLYPKVPVPPRIQTAQAQ